MIKDRRLCVVLTSEGGSVSGSDRLQVVMCVCECVSVCFFRRLCAEECVGEVKTALGLIAVGSVGAVAR